MTSTRLPTSEDPIHPATPEILEISFDGEQVEGLVGQTIGGILLGSGRLAWRITSADEQPRGIFCGIGVCYDCLVVVNGLRDVRACQRRAIAGDVVTTQHDPLPEARS
jgi:predicted molibdopterin-dependent oxidoreductase YjgC